MYILKLVWYTMLFSFDFGLFIKEQKKKRNGFFDYFIPYIGTNATKSVLTIALSSRKFN